MDVYKNIISHKATATGRASVHQSDYEWKTPQWSGNVVKIATTCEVSSARLVEWRSLVFPTLDAARSAQVTLPLVSALLCVLWGQVRASTKNTYRDKLRTDTFRFTHNTHVVKYCFLRFFADSGERLSFILVPLREFLVPSILGNKWRFCLYLRLYICIGCTSKSGDS